LVRKKGIVFFLAKARKESWGRKLHEDSSDGLAGSFTSQADLPLSPI
jgi:hypothetical protein